MRSVLLRVVMVVVIVFAALSAAIAPARAQQVEQYDLRIERQSLSTALQEFARQSGVQIIFFSSITDGFEAPALEGRFTAAAALSGLLNGSNLTYREINTKTIEVRPMTVERRSMTDVGEREPSAQGSVAKPIRLAGSEGGRRSRANEQTARNQESQAGVADEVIVLGSRRTDRTVSESAVPIDVFQPEAIEHTGYADLNDALRSLIPSFNAQRLPLNDGSSFVRPITLRGSPADHVLLLMNGKRRHRSAIVQIGTGHATTSGSQGQDFNAIPPIAFERVEVMRDGAAAQYGSDAIAGVINMALKDKASGGSMVSQVGQYFAGDGESVDVQGNVGLPLTSAGFLNLSGQYSHQKKTFRGGPLAGAEAMRAAGLPGVPKNPLELGEPYYEAFKLVWNAGVELSDGTRGYLFGNYLSSDSSIGFFYRQPLAGGGFPANSAYANSAFDHTAAHPQGFDLAAIYPGGFVPQFSGAITDFSTVAGVRHDDGSGFTFDVSARIGIDEVEYTLENTINASLGARSPTRFKPGSLQQRETEGSAEASYEFTEAVLLFGGVSYRKEEYEIGAGDPASYAVGPLRDLPVGANGFQGFSPNVAGTFSTDSYAAFVELDTDLTSRWSSSLAARYEDYAAFGDNFSYKIATRFVLTDVLALRGAVSTGFRAPAAGQLFGSSQTSQISTLTNDFILDAVLIPGSPEAQVFGSTTLEPETSFNVSAGMVIDTARGLLATIDFYQIEIDDRLLLTPPVATTSGQRQQLAALGFANAGSVQQVRFFQNKLNTRVRGVDLVAIYSRDWNGSHASDVSVAINHNEQTLRGNPAAVFFDSGTVAEFEEGIPEWRGILTATHHVGDFDFLLRGTYYGAWKRRDGRSFLPRSAETLVDAEMTYRGLDMFEITLGARNLFDQMPPDRGPAMRSLGMIRDNHSPYGLSGGFYYLTTRFKF